MVKPFGPSTTSVSEIGPYPLSGSPVRRYVSTLPQLISKGVGFNVRGDELGSLEPQAIKEVVAAATIDKGFVS